MIEIALIRPGATDYDAQGRIRGTLDLPLSDAGEAEVRRIVAELREPGLETIYASPDQAAWQTASSIAEALGARLKKLEQLRNLDHGLWQGMLVEEVSASNPRFSANGRSSQRRSVRRKERPWVRPKSGCRHRFVKWSRSKKVAELAWLCPSR